MSRFFFFFFPPSSSWLLLLSPILLQLLLLLLRRFLSPCPDDDDDDNRRETRGLRLNPLLLPFVPVRIGFRIIFVVVVVLAFCTRNLWCPHAEHDRSVFVFNNVHWRQVHPQLSPSSLSSSSTSCGWFWFWLRPRFRLRLWMLLLLSYLKKWFSSLSSASNISTFVLFRRGGGRSVPLVVGDGDDASFPASAVSFCFWRNTLIKVTCKPVIINKLIHCTQFVVTSCTTPSSIATSPPVVLASASTVLATSTAAATAAAVTVASGLVAIVEITIIAIIVVVKNIDEDIEEIINIILSTSRTVSSQNFLVICWDWRTQQPLTNISTTVQTRYRPWLYQSNRSGELGAPTRIESSRRRTAYSILNSLDKYMRWEGGGCMGDVLVSCAQDRRQEEIALFFNFVRTCWYTGCVWRALVGWELDVWPLYATTLRSQDIMVLYDNAVSWIQKSYAFSGLTTSSCYCHLGPMI